MTNDNSTAFGSRGTWTILFIIFLLIAALISFFASRIEKGNPDLLDIKFDAPIWKQDTRDTQTKGEKRASMVNDLVASKRLIGLTSAELIDLLGIFDSAGDYRHYKDGYYVANRSMAGFGHSLCFTFNDQDRVVWAGIVMNEYR